MSTSLESSLDETMPPLSSPAFQRLDVAAVKAAELMEEFANVEDPYSNADDNPWANPDQIFQQLRGARDEVMEAWRQVEEETEAYRSKAADSTTKSKLDAERCRALYMDMITDAFADTLENMRTAAGDDLDVDVLVDCLQSGLDLLTAEEQETLFANTLDHEFDGEEGEADADQDEDGLTAHEAYRRKMGLNVSVSG